MASCATKPFASFPVQIGDLERTMMTKMVSKGARDVTALTESTYVAQICLEQRYYWWEFPDKTIAAVLVAAPAKKAKTVMEYEISEPGVGIEGIKNWSFLRISQKHFRSQSLIGPKVKPFHWWE